MTAAPARSRWMDRVGGLFPPAPPRQVSLGRGVPLAITAVIAGAAVSLARQPGAAPWDTVWAEDGEIFLTGAVSSSLPGAFTASYAGYFHTGPRLLAELAAAFPARADAAVLAVSAAVLTAVLGVLVYVASAAHLPSRVARVAAAAIVVVPPLAQQDVPNSIANLHWPALYALFWMLLWSPARWPARAVAVTTVALVVTSDILVVALLPLAVLRLVYRRDRYDALLAAVFASGVALQLIGLVTGASSRDTDLNPIRAMVGYLLRAVPAGLLGSRWLGEDHTSARWLGLAGLAWLLLAVAVMTALVLAARRLLRPDWTLAAAAGLQGLALYLLPVFLSGDATERYAVAPAMLLVVALLALLLGGSGGRDGPMAPQRDRGRPGAPAVALLILLAVVCAVNLRVPNSRAEGPSWSEELDRARAECVTQADTRVPIRISPRDAGWYTELPCAYIER